MSRYQQAAEARVYVTHETSGLRGGSHGGGPRQYHLGGGHDPVDVDCGHRDGVGLAIVPGGPHGRGGFDADVLRSVGAVSCGRHGTKEPDAGSGHRRGEMKGTSVALDDHPSTTKDLAHILERRVGGHDGGSVRLGCDLLGGSPLRPAAPDHE